MSVSRRSAACVAAVVLTLGLSGCGHVPAQTMWALRKFDPMTADPRLLRAAIAAPAGNLPAKGGGKLVMTQARKDGADEEKIEIPLEEVSLAAETGLAAVKPHAGQVVRAFRIPEAEIGRLVAARERAKARAAREPGAFTGTLSVGLDGCRVAGAPTPKEFRISTWIKTEQTDGYVTLLDDVDLVALVGAAALERDAPICPAP